MRKVGVMRELVARAFKVNVSKRCVPLWSLSFLTPVKPGEEDGTVWSIFAAL